MTVKGYTMKDGRFADTLDATLFPPNTTLTATTNGTALELGDRGTARLDLTVTAASGSGPTLDVAVQTSPDGSTWTAVASFTQANAAGTQHKVFTGLDRFVRAVATIGGSGPSFTFSVGGEAV